MSKQLGCWCMDDLICYEPNTGCWLWLGRLNNHGYAVFSKTYIHRQNWIEANGPVPDGLELDHLCRVPQCVNPSHLEPVTHRENMRRGYGVSGIHARKTTCPQGHPYDQVVRRSNGVVGRRCSLCHVATNLASRRRVREIGGRINA